MTKPSTASQSDEPRGSRFTAFAGSRCIASGDLQTAASKSKELLDRDKSASVLIFDDATSEVIEVDFRGTTRDVLRRLEKSAEVNSFPANPDQPCKRTPRSPGRPKLGVVAREVTLLPRHWDWLATQSGGASVALRKLVEEAKRANIGKDRQRQAREATYKFMSVAAGNEPGFEEATRALFGDNRKGFDKIVKSWPVDVRTHAKKLASLAFAP